MSAATNFQRNKMVRDARWAAANQLPIHYAETRPIPLHIGRRHLPFTTDCSGFVTMLAYWAGMSDPNGANYSGWGYTGTLLNHLPHISRKDARYGDLVVFGNGTGNHVVMLLQTVKRHSNPLVVSHGWEGEPAIMTLSVQQAGQGGDTRYLRSQR